LRVSIRRLRRLPVQRLVCIILYQSAVARIASGELQPEGRKKRGRAASAKQVSVTMRRPLAVNSNMKSRLQNAAQLEAAGKPTQRLEL
jgi:hypothetical protein